MLIKNTDARPWTIAGQLLIPGADPVEVECTEADIAGVPGLEVVKEKAKPGPKPKADE